MRFEVTTLPVADADRAKAFYQRLGWRVDTDIELGKGPMPGPDPEGRSYSSLASFSDPDAVAPAGGHRADPESGLIMDVASRAQLLLETSLRHGAFEEVAPPHD
jgi:catechol 2,3-dioxygenase-like lactoylglutathione lyase family enzyme